MKEIIAYAVMAGFVGLLLLLLVVIVRYSIILPYRTRGAPGRLRHPEPDGIATLCGFAPPQELLQLFLDGPFVEHMEFDLVDRRAQPPKEWSIGGFIPLTSLDVSAAREEFGVRDGIPIADDGLGGVYVVLRSGAVVLRSPEAPGGAAVVAQSVRDLWSFEARLPDIARSDRA
jgi:hypothetical protein